MKTRFLLLLFLVLAVPVAHAETDPLVSLFNFQLRMAEGGNVKAMMKVGEMYENGEGTPRDYGKALEMYRRARAKGEPTAEAAIRRVEAKRRRAAGRTSPSSGAAGPATSKTRTATPQKRSPQKKPRTESSRKAAREKARREAAARKAAQEKARREAAAREKARREAAARKAAQERARREAEARRAAQRKEQARREAAARKAEAERARREASGTASSSPASEDDSAPESATPAESGKDTADRPKKFSSDPCKTRAARFLSSCRKK